jgi:hypothetical protein
MILKLIDGKVLIETMYVPELVERTYVEYVFEPNTQHLHPVMYLNEKLFRGNKEYIYISLEQQIINVKVELLDDNNHIVRTYVSNLPYNVYQILGQKPIRPNIEDYLYKLEEEIRVLKQALLDEKQKLIDEQLRLAAVIKEIEEKGEIV